MGTKKPADLTTRVLVEIRDELKGHRTQFTEIHEELKEHRTKFTEIHEELKEHRGQFVEIRDELREHRAQLAGLGTTMTQVLRAVEHGNAERDQRVGDHEGRISRLEERAGIHS